MSIEWSTVLRAPKKKAQGVDYAGQNRLQILALCAKIVLICDVMYVIFHLNRT